MRRFPWLGGACALFFSCLQAQARVSGPEPEVNVFSDFDAQFARQVDHRLQVPERDQALYVAMVENALEGAGITGLTPQWMLVVDRSASVQAAFLLIRSDASHWHWVGATAISTGRRGGFAHFITPLGVFLHSPANPDYRAEGSYNVNHIRGYGVQGMRVYDFGWQVAERTWGTGGESRMRLAAHATDPERLEASLGSAASEGCIRMPASLNHFLDHYGVLDAEYEVASAQGKAQRVLLADRNPMIGAGRYLVVMDSHTSLRPPWAVKAR